MCFKTTTIVPVPKKSPVSCLNDHRPITLTPTIMKCFERLILRRLRSAHLPPTILTSFYRGTIESLLGNCITACLGNCTQLDCKNLQPRAASIRRAALWKTPPTPHIEFIPPLHVAECTVAYGLSRPEYKIASSPRPYDSTITG